MLNTYHLDELLQKINEEKDNISILIEKKKEKTAKKLFPILIEVKKRMIPDKKKNDKNIITKLVGFCYLDLNDKISNRTPYPQKAIALGVPIPSNDNFRV